MEHEKAKKIWKMKLTVILIITGALGTVPKRFVNGLEDLEMNWNYPEYSIIKIGQNTEKSTGDLRLAVTQTPVKNDQLMLVRKTLKEIIIIIIIITPMGL